MGSRCLQDSFKQHTITRRGGGGLNETALSKWHHTDIRLTLKLWLDLDELNSTRLGHYGRCKQSLFKFIWGPTATNVNIHFQECLSLDELVGLCCCCSATDWRFAFTREGKNVPFATAGDCYSAARCPQVRTTAVQQTVVLSSLAVIINDGSVLFSVLVSHSINK